MDLDSLLKLLRDNITYTPGDHHFTICGYEIEFRQPERAMYVRNLLTDELYELLCSWIAEQNAPTLEDIKKVRDKHGIPNFPQPPEAET